MHDRYPCQSSSARTGVPISFWWDARTQSSNGPPRTCAPSKLAGVGSRAFCIARFDSLELCRLHLPGRGIVPGLAFLIRMVHRVTVTAMPPKAHAWNLVPFALAALFCSLGIRSDTLPHPPSSLAALPRVTLWAWERREDLHAIDTRRFAVAYLDQTLTIGVTVGRQPRRDLLVFPASATRIPVVRIEAPPNAVLNAENRSDAVNAILRSAREPGIAALQVDFDATRSQRPFYRDLLVDLRSRMPAGLPLSITALASWCSFDDWLARPSRRRSRSHDVSHGARPPPRFAQS